PDSWVLKTDVEGYYAHIDHMVLYNQLQALIPNEQYLLRLTWQFLKRTVYADGNYYDREQGISLGNPLSPLMAALYLTPLDAEFEGKEWFYARFMDDWVIISPTRWKLNSAVQKVNLILNQHGLTSDKTFIGRSSKGFDFLGYNFTPESLTAGKNSLQRRDARLHRLYEQGADEVRIGEHVSHWQQWAKTGLQEQETEELHNIPRQADSSKLPLEAKFLALGVASVMSTAAFDSHATVYQISSIDNGFPDGAALSTCAGVPAFDFGSGTNFTQTGGGTNYKKSLFNYASSIRSGSTTSYAQFDLSSTYMRFGIKVGGANGTDANDAFNIQLPYIKTLDCLNCAEPKLLWIRLDADQLTSFGKATNWTYSYGWADSGTPPTLANTASLANTTCPGGGAPVQADASNPIVTLLLG
ncbi:reverse transcriptase domain-containing protein, partial [Candidatus Halobeggiatoa sp. HSG11]|nr:reverse transcriptase domain-containing protein [Candidatus Halobeggiatoa sp. HSG11]